MDKRYVKFPTSMIEFIITARLTENQNKMLHAAIRNCHGFHQINRFFSLRDLGRWLGWDRRSVHRTAEELVQRSILSRAARGYHMENDAQKWQPDWRRVAGRAEDIHDPNVSSVDKLLISPDQPTLFGTFLSSHGMTFVIPRAHLSTEIGRSDQNDQITSNSAIQNPKSEIQNCQIADASEFLKISLKKLFKEKGDPDGEKRKETQKKKNRIFMEMSRSGLWPDAELLELARNLTAEELEAVYYARRRTG